MSVMRKLCDGLQLPEGPVWLSDGSLLLVEMIRQTLTRVEPDGSASIVARLGGGPNSAAFGPDGAIYVPNNGGICHRSENGRVIPVHGVPDDYECGYIQRVDVTTGEVTVLYRECDGNPLAGPNDLVFDEEGGFYFTDTGKLRSRSCDLGGLYYALPDGKSIRELAYPIDFANGVGLSPDGRYLYVAETTRGRVWRWEIESPGVLRKEESRLATAGGTLLVGLPGNQWIDSLAIDSLGNVCVATIAEQGCISVIAPNGNLLRQMPVPFNQHVTNICFGGPDFETAFITASTVGAVYCVDWPCPGLPLNFGGACGLGVGGRMG